MHLLKMEFYKLRHKKMGMMISCLALFQLLYMTWAIGRMIPKSFGQEWKVCLYTAFQINIFIMPIFIAMIASRLSDVEHKGSTLKYLRTIVTERKLFNTKILCGAIYLVTFIALQMGMMLVIGMGKGFTEELPVSQLIYYVVITFFVDFTLLILQMNLSLLMTNQMIALIVAVAGTFLGLYSMFFSEAIARWILWGYYAVLAPVRMNWDSVTGTTDFYWTQMPMESFVILLMILAVLYIVGKKLFIRKEQ